MKKPLISLCMIVKDEEDVLRDCLESVKNIVDEFIIVDTGSTDTTMDIIREYSKTDVIQIPFENFVDTKNKALQHATGEYVLWIDADERLVSGHQSLRKLAESHRDFVIVGNLKYPTMIQNRTILWKNKHDVKFEGPYVHEYLAAKMEYVKIEDILIVPVFKENKDWAGRLNFYKSMLHRYLDERGPDTRALQHLGQTYGEMGDNDKAIECYKQYIDLPDNYPDERNWVYYQISTLLFRQNNFDLSIMYAIQGLKRDNKRSEFWYMLGLNHYTKKEFHEAMSYFEMCLQSTYEHVGHFKDIPTYNYMTYDYLAICYAELKNFNKAYNILDRYKTEFNSEFINNPRLVSNYHFFENILRGNAG